MSQLDAVPLDVAMDTDVSTYDSMAHAKRRRANSVPNGYRIRTASKLQSRSDAIRMSDASTENTPNESDDSDDSQPPSADQRPEPAPIVHVPHWQRELAKSRVGRHSRASSIISTRTRLTVQSDDARSVDIEAGGQSYHINRDGSMVTNITAPPPYPGPPLHQLAEESDEEESLTRLSSDTVRDEPSIPETSIDHSLQSLPIRTHLPPTPSNDETSATNSRKTSAFELPRPFRQVLNLSWYRSPPSAGTPAATAPETTPSKSVGYLRRTKSDSSSLANFRSFESTATHPDELSGKGNSNTSSSDTDDSIPTVSRPKDDRLHHSYPHPSPHPDDSDDLTAELTTHYTRLFRTLDRTHRTQLHERDVELSNLRELLNEKDIIYRQQLRGRDHMISELQDQVRRAERTVIEVKRGSRAVDEDVERRVEKARNEVEDMWERRWKEFERCLRERLGGGSKEVEVLSKTKWEVRGDDRGIEGRSTSDDQSTNIRTPRSDPEPRKLTNSIIAGLGSHLNQPTHNG